MYTIGEYKVTIALKYTLLTMYLQTKDILRKIMHLIEQIQNIYIHMVTYIDVFVYSYIIKNRKYYYVNNRHCIIILFYVRILQNCCKITFMH